ncbi:MAG: SDR family NAD(P)-dependent oxidoreductase [Xanthobacteraceae bacterium]|jgi:NAD(P)-dependent dehydrogenase (short-subunit alcohol dehydrogenase family)
MRLKNKKALVIGGSSGIGLSIAEGFAAEGARLGIIGRRQEKLDAALASLRKQNDDAIALTADMRGAKACREAIDKITAALGGLDILVNSQGITVVKPSAEMTEAEYLSVIDTDLNSVFFSCQAAYKHMRGKGGSIISIASLAGHRGWPLAAPYAASKHGVLAITKTLATEWASEKIRVNSISPGYFHTELTSTLKPERVQLATSRTPMGRFGELPELQGAAVFLASEDATYVTGADIAVDGGFLGKGL